MKLFAFLIVALVFIAACSTEKNTLVSRTYHGTTAHYNGYFNANELIRQSMTGYLDARKEDYYSLLPLNPVPNEEEVKGMYPSIDTAIAKSTEVIAKHSMPTASEPSKKRSEHNAWIDENWLTIGIANYYRRDYETAQKNFRYINKFFANDPSNYTAAIWMAKTHIQTRNFSDANLILMELDKKIAEQEAAKESKEPKSKKSKTKKKKKSKSKKPEEENVQAEFPKKSRYLLETTKAELAILQEDKDKAIEYLEKALEYAKKSSQKARIHYILAQLNGQKQQYDKAKYHYSRVLRHNAPFEMAFNARINRALMGGDAKIKKELEKMLRDEKNLEFKDQIYFALADIAFKEGNKDKGVENLHKSILFSTSNNRQKAMSYEKLGDMNFASRDYVKAQKYYDSCAKVLPDTYPNADGIRNKATKLKDLVVAVETAAYEDSVQRIAAMSEEDRYKFAENVIRKMKEDEKRRKEEEAIRLKELQSQQAANENTTSGNKFFWNSPKLKSEGLESFRKLWGARENEDNWRRSDKIVLASFDDPEIDSADVNTGEEVKDSITPESLLAHLPVNDSLIALSNERMLNAYYDAGIIYKDQLNETQMAVKQFQAILDRKMASDFNLLALYQLYKIYEISDPPLAYSYKSEILISYPDSDYANYLRDPDYFMKRKEIEKLAEEDYLKSMDRYKRGLYSLVISAADDLIANDKKNNYRAKYMLLKALSIAETSEDKTEMLPVLKQVIAEYPGTMEEKKARELIEIQEKGYSAFVESNFENKSIYKYEDNADQWIIIIPEKKLNLSTAKNRVTDFNREFYNKNKYTVVTKVLGMDQNVIVVKEMSEEKGRDYIRTYKKTKKLMEMQDAKIMMITQENMKILFDSQVLSTYEDFYSEFY
ncbi:MAG: tetratricopeptide repeat protein [Bacteroidota bacterium]